MDFIKPIYAASSFPAARKNVGVELLIQPRSQALSPFPPLSSTTKEEKERETGNEVATNKLFPWVTRHVFGIRRSRAGLNGKLWY